MESSRIRQWSEAVGLLAVVASLVFVGVEVGQNAEATRSATAQSLNDGWLEWNLTMAVPENWAAVVRMIETPDLSEARYEDRLAVVSLNRSVFQHWSTLHWQYLHGDLDQQLWDGVLKNMEANIRDADWGRLMEWVWEGQGQIYHAEFQLLFDDMWAEHRGR